MKFYLITGRNNGIPVEPFVANENTLSSALVEHAGMRRYCQEITEAKADEICEEELAVLGHKETAKSVGLLGFIEKEIYRHSLTGEDCDDYVVKVLEKVRAKAEEQMAMQKEFFNLCSIVETDTGAEVVFWKDENYEYAKALLKKIKEAGK